MPMLRLPSALAAAALLGCGACAAQPQAPLLTQLPAPDLDTPFVISPDRVTQVMLSMAELRAGDRMVDLGSGDGRLVIGAARRGIEAFGFEIDPTLIERSQVNARRAGVSERATFRAQDIFTADLSGYDVITMYLLPDVNLKLRPSLLALKPGTRIVSHDWGMGDWQPDWSVTVPVPDKPVGRERSSRIMRWTVPAPVQGDWCGEGAAAGTRLGLSQRYQQVQATLTVGEAVHTFDGRLDGERLVSPVLQAQWAPGRLQVEQARGPLAAAVVGRFVPAPAGGCR
jgi:SAM-dependent methyltransferase